MNWFHLGLAGLMLVTGSINTLSVKWADTMTSESTDGKVRGFDHPFLQACGMFLGETMCMAAFFLLRWRRRRALRAAGADPAQDPFTRPRTFSPLVFLPPALCDMTATSIQYIGLTLTYASSFQMLRGAVIVFTGLFSRIFLRRRLGPLKWLGIFFVIVGLAVVGVCDMIYGKHDGGGGKNATGVSFDRPLFHAEYVGGSIRGGNPDDLDAFPYGHVVDGEFRVRGSSAEPNRSSSDMVLGDVLIVCAQVIVATQMVYEEKFITKYNVPALQAVGWEGTFGFLTMSTLLIPMYFIPVGPKFGNNPRHVLEDAYDGLYQLAHNGLLLTAFCGTVVSIAFFNFAGISVTKEMSATTRMVLDSVRTLVIWGVSLAVGWQEFRWLQLLGFVVLVVGMCIYNDIVIVPGLRWLCVRLGLCVGDPYSDLDEDVRRQLGEEEEDGARDQTDSADGNGRRRRRRRRGGREGEILNGEEEHEEEQGGGGEMGDGVAYRPE